MLTIFIRHNWKQWKKDSPQLDKMVPELIKDNQMGIHFQSNPITECDKSDSEKWVDSDDGRKALEIMKKMATEGALVFASYSTPKGNHIKLGKIEPQEIQLVPVKNKPDHYIKALKMSNSREEKNPILLAIQGIIRTIFDFSNNKQKCKILECLYEKKDLPEEVDSLIPAQQEVLCYEYLKSERKIENLLLPIGRTLEKIDIYGIDRQGNYVFAQVTYHSEEAKNNSKLNALIHYKTYKGKQSKLYFFSNSEKKGNIDGVEYIPLNDVFDHFKESIMIREMLNYSK